MSRLTVQELAPAFGAEVFGFDPKHVTVDDNDAMATSIGRGYGDALRHLKVMVEQEGRDR